LLTRSRPSIPDGDRIIVIEETAESISRAELAAVRARRAQLRWVIESRLPAELSSTDILHLPARLSALPRPSHGGQPRATSFRG